MSSAISPEPRLSSGLLVLRLGFGLSLLFLFGVAKIKAASGYLHTGQWQFVDFNRKFGVPLPVVSACIQTLNESLGALLVACGIATRWAAAFLTIGFAAASWYSMKAQDGGFLMAAFYCIAFLAIVLTGPGRFSIDQWLSSRSGRE
jgi:putative oxidoreductase